MLTICAFGLSEVSIGKNLLFKWKEIMTGSLILHYFINNIATTESTGSAKMNDARFHSQRRLHRQEFGLMEGVET